MAQNRTFNLEVRFMVDESLMKKIDAAMIKKGFTKKNEFLRVTLEDALMRTLVEDEIDIVTATIRKVIKEELKVSENRIAKIVAKAANAAATTMYMCYQVLASLGTKNMPAIYEAARKKGVAFVKTPLDELLIDEKGSGREDIS